jgi:hypothetical protein
MPQSETILRLRLSSAITRGGSHADDHTEISATPSLGGANRAVRRLSGPASAQSITAVTAATALLDRGYGKPQQHIDAEIGSYVARLPRPYDTTEEWEAAVKLELAMNQRPELEGETAEC